MQQPIWNFEQESQEKGDETSTNLRAYFDRMDDEKMRQYDPAWSDDKIIQWDGNFTSEGALLVPCCERDIDVQEYRQVIERAIAYRNGVRDKLS